ncbi:MAG: hypothetical protein COS36_04400 [Candidatus Altarchaeum sp. CG03_land_8_20_14_0_80_32_618]|nr:MAG: hypothetical protein AUK59_00645 [Candidatus Altarchaeum sp. CG2_30_32_3053]PIV27823.1 MAG: hypothetical protein COS36_04400 [Candidatus Altarchaeum sp. CG03_land_8_20_14_0_80_32_618]PIZ32172.1 MAG: hypothetical protein COY41_01570 [Candidatus Altarchaeum sp. CG_4_10_14_0_8_um_filter_32_851]PJC14665.1 MAG: hypothetical protein CO063_02430 [Candidatus Altarchaeum sp. CG_4_9_14_0_8_um_filter_32_206]
MKISKIFSILKSQRFLKIENLKDFQYILKSVDFKNAPADASLVCSSVNCSLNREETLSVYDILLTDNIPEENQRSGRTGQDLQVPVLNMQANSSDQ